MTTLTPAIMQHGMPETTSPTVDFLAAIHWTKPPANVDEAEAKLREQDEWFKKNQAAVLRHAEESTRRLTGKPAL